MPRPFTLKRTGGGRISSAEAGKKRSRARAEKGVAGPSFYGDRVFLAVYRLSFSVFSRQIFSSEALRGCCFLPSPTPTTCCERLDTCSLDAAESFFVYYRIGKNRVQFKPVLSALSADFSRRNPDAGGLSHPFSAAPYQRSGLLRRISFALPVRQTGLFAPDPEKVSDGQFLLAMLLGEILFLIAAFLGGEIRLYPGRKNPAGKNV